MKNIGLIYGGRSNEWEISVITAIQIMNNWNLNANMIPLFMKDGDLIIPNNPKSFSSYKVRPAGKTVDFIEGGIQKGHRKLMLSSVIFATHGGEGEDGRLKGVLSYYSIPYCTASWESMALCMNKYLFKQYLNGVGIPSVEGYKIRSADVPSDFPCILKPNRLGSSIGIQVVNSAEEFEEKSRISFSYDEEILVEKFLTDFEEYSIATLYDGKDVVFSWIEKQCGYEKFYTFADKYESDAIKTELPAQLSPLIEDKIKEAVSFIVKDLSLFGVVRTDFLFDRIEEKLYVNEVNTIPGSLAYRLFMGCGISLGSLINHLAEIGEARKEKKAYYSTGILENYRSGGKK